MENKEKEDPKVLEGLQVHQEKLEPLETLDHPDLLESLEPLV